MGQLGNLRDFILIARATQGAADFHERIRGALRLAAASLSQVAWRADFDVGPGEHVEIFGAPDSGYARKVSELVTAIPGVRAEIAPLRKGW
jgi:hypothetical protein